MRESRRSSHARTLGVPHAAVGILGYAVMAVLALWRFDANRGGRWRERALVTTATSASTASAYLTWKQAARVRAWCWNFVLLPPALTIFTQALLFSIVGLPGVFLATPMLARIRVLVLDV